MKKLSCILLAVMLITAMFVSCTAEVIDPYDGLAYVTFGGPASKDLSASYEVQSYESLYWFYTAKKADGFGKTGETNEETPLAGTVETPAKGLGGKIGPFSQGVWDFDLKAYSIDDGNKTLVYMGSANDIKLTKSELKSVPVSVTPQGDYGTIEFRNAYFRWNEDNGGSDKPTIKITAVGTSKTYTLLSGISAADEYGNIPLEWSTKDGNLSIDSKYPEVLSDYYNCKIVAWVVDEFSPIFEQSFGIRVYGSATTVISGDITEKVDSFVDFEVSQEDLVVFKGASTMEVLSTPSNASDKFTTVDFGSNLDVNTTYSLSVKSTTAEEAAAKFTVSSGSAAVAGIDLTLTNVDNKETESSFGSEITITTYISTGLSGVKVLYGNDGMDYLKSYNSSTGELVFTTNHFSEYYVVSNAVASIGNTGYAFIQDAIDAASEGATVSLLKDVDLVETVDINKKITLDFQNHELSSAKFYALRVGKGGDATLCGDGTITSVASSVLVYDDGRLVVDGCTIISSGNCGLCVGHLSPNSGEVTDSSSATATIKNATITAQEAAIMVFDESSLTINDGVFTAKDNFVVGMNGRKLLNNGNKEGCSIEINGGVFNGNIMTDGYIACGVYICNKGTVTLNGGTFNIVDGVGVLVRSGELIANSGVIFNIKKTGNKSCGGIGDASAMISLGSPIVIEDYNCITYPGGKPSCKNNSTYAGRYVSYEASIGDVYYESIHDAVAAATADKTVKVLEDVDLEHTIVVNGKAVLDINGKTISNSDDLWDARPNDWSLISVRENGDLTITGNGTLQAKENDCYAVDVQDGATLTIKDGKFVGNMHAVYVHTGKANIEGGTYSVLQKYPDASKADEFVLNCYDASRANGTAKIVVTGGSFANFNPADCFAEGAHTNFLETGYTTTSKEDAKITWWTVVKNSDC